MKHPRLIFVAPVNWALFCAVLISGGTALGLIVLGHPVSTSWVTSLAIFKRAVPVLIFFNCSWFLADEEIRTALKLTTLKIFVCGGFMGGGIYFYCIAMQIIQSAARLESLALTFVAGGIGCAAIYLYASKQLDSDGRPKRIEEQGK